MALVPLAPATSHRNIFRYQADVLITPTDPRDAPFDAHAVYVLSNNKFPFAGGNILRSSDGSFTPADLKRGTQYFYTARSHNRFGWSAWAAMRSFTTDIDVPTIGTSYTASSITRNSATITGLSVTDTGGGTLDNARVEFNTSASATGATTVTRGSWGDVSLAGLTEGVQYYYRAAAHNSKGWSAYPTTWKTFSTIMNAPSDMAPPTFSNVGDTSFRVNWLAPNLNGSELVSYQWELSTSSTFSPVQRTDTTENLFVDVAGLQAGTRYYVRVRANATPNNSGYGTANQQTTGTAASSGIRTYAVIDGIVRQGTLYAVVGGTVRQLRPTAMLSGNLETE